MIRIPTIAALLVLAVAATLVASSAAPAAESRPDVVYRWECRVLTEEQVIALGKKDLADGLNALGDEGWELVTAGPRYIFKRPRDVAKKQAAEIRRQIIAAEADVAAWTDRVAWSERMLKKGYVTEKYVQAERAQLSKAEAVLDAARRALKGVPPTPKEPEQQKPRPEK